MANSLKYSWRLLATALAFGAFGGGALVLTTLVLPVVSRLPGDPQRRARRARRVASGAFRLFVRFVRVVGLMSLRVEDPQRLRAVGPCLIVANHPTLIDIVLLVALIPEVCCVAKQALWQNPLLRGFVRAADYVPRAGTQQTIDECVARIQRGESLVIFPEGTRSPEQGMRRFDRGAAAIVERARCPVVPVTLSCEPPALGKRDPWYLVARHRHRVEVRVYEPVDAREVVPACRSEGIFRRRLTAFLQNWFEEKLAHERPVAARA